MPSCAKQELTLDEAPRPGRAGDAGGEQLSLGPVVCASAVNCMTRRRAARCPPSG
jgi:hypothetical protein